MIVPPRTHLPRRNPRSAEPDWRSVVLGSGALLILVAGCYCLLALAGH